MAEIEFKRRGTPVWAVVLVLLVVAGALYFFFGRGSDTPTTATADSAAATGPVAATPGAGTPVPPPPTPATSPVQVYASWVDSAHTARTAAEMPAYVSSGLRLMADAMTQAAPMAGVQLVLVRAMADTVAMPATPARKQLDATQAAFFAVQYAFKDKPVGAQLENAAARIDLKKPLASQSEAVKHFFQVARDVLRDPSKAAPAAKPAAQPKA